MTFGYNIDQAVVPKFDYQPAKTDPIIAIPGTQAHAAIAGVGFVPKNIVWNTPDTIAKPPMSVV